MAAVTASMRKLRVALVFGGTLQAEETLDRPQPVSLGYGAHDVLPLPADQAEGGSLLLLTPTGNGGYQLSLTPQMGGSVWLGGQRKEVAELRGTGQPVQLGPDDYGVVTLGRAAFFFQMVKGAPRIGRGLPAFFAEPARVLSLALSVFLHAAVGFLFFLAVEEAGPVTDDSELALDLVRRFMVTPPPEDVIEEQDVGGTETEDPGIRDREEAGGTADEGEEGRVGREDAQQEETEMEGEITGGGAAERVSHLGLLGAIRGGDSEESALDAALEGPSIGDLLGGLNSGRTVMGRGSGGTGLRGSGSDGGKTNPGTLFDAGNMNTDVGAGRGAGGGRGGGGPGARGRPAREVRVQVQTRRPRVNGYLSPEQIMRVVRRNQAAVRYCYENELQRQPNLAGRITIHWRISRSGSVSSARVGNSSMHNARVEGCIVRQVRRWRFPQPDGGEVDVDFPFIFGTGG
ncbi:MAG TPA: AgmX/PglI C-terminal domain-containing protein [Sandaracinaceae bacterium LLY-WYZ-13_1]|nr:AgmX/PglI C-terminal domain-containing protein [Sandaracinaceae bacterium LLY-WYZ-13_1]